MPGVAARSGHMTTSPIRQVMNLAETLPGVIRLEVGEPDFGTPEPIVRAAQRALDEGWTKYTTSAGILPLREALARYEAAKLGWTPDPAREVCAASGGTGALYLSFLALLNAGDEVLVPDPGWPQYYNIVRLCGGVPVPYALDPQNGFAVDRETVIAALSPRTKAILLNSPANPTGSVLGGDDLAFFARTAQERDLWAVSDEVYERIVFDGAEHYSIAALAGMRERTVVVNAFSKTFAMTGWRLGYLVAPAAVVEAATKFQGHIISSPTAAVQVAGIAALELPSSVVDEMVVEYGARRDAFVAALAHVPQVRYVTPRGAFYMFVDFSAYDLPDVELATVLLREARVSSVPGSGFGKLGRGSLRFSFVRSPQEIATGVCNIGQVLAKLPALAAAGR